MVFFTRCFRRISLKKNHLSPIKLAIKLRRYAGLLMAFALLNVSSIAFAASSIIINQAELQPLDDYYALSADVDIFFDEAIVEAVSKGVPLHFLIEFQVVKPWQYWFDDEIVITSTSVSLSYHALSRQYLVNHGAHQKSFETLDEAKDALFEIYNWKVLDKSLIEKGETYNAALLVRLDQSKLPKAIQVDAIGSEKWNLTSQKYEWALKDLAGKDANSKDSTNKDVSNKEANKEFSGKDFTKDVNKDLKIKESGNLKELSGKELK